MNIIYTANNPNPGSRAGTGGKGCRLCGLIVKEADLVQVLEQRLVGGTGLDEYEDEPQAHPGLAQRSNVVMVPHIGNAAAHGGDGG